jgi:large repetitive protein
VTFKNGTISLGTATLNACGAGILAKANLTAGRLSITAEYNGDSERARGTSLASCAITNNLTRLSGVD